MGELQPTHPKIATRTGAAAGARDAVGGVLHLHQGRRRNHSADYADRGAHRDRRAAADRDHALARDEIAGDAATWRRFLFQACLNSVIPWTMMAWGDAGAGRRPCHHPQFDLADLHVFPDLAVTRHEAVTSRKLLGVVAGMAGICLIVGDAGAGRTRRAIRGADRHVVRRDLLRGRGDLRPRLQGSRSDGAGSGIAALRRRDPDTG